MALPHVAHIVTIAVLIAVVGMSCASLGVSWLIVKGSNLSAAAATLNPVTSAEQKLRAFRQCTKQVSPLAAYAKDSCVTWGTYWETNTQYCPTIGATGDIDTDKMLRLMRTAEAGGVLYMVGTVFHLIIVVVWSLGLIKPWFVALPTYGLSIFGWLLSIVLWGVMYHACDENFCSATQSAYKSLGYQTTHCSIADGFRVQIASFILFMLCLIPLIVFKRPGDEAAAEPAAKNEPVNDPTTVPAETQPKADPTAEAVSSPDEHANLDEHTNLNTATTSA